MNDLDIRKLMNGEFDFPASDVLDSIYWDLYEGISIQNEKLMQKPLTMAEFNDIFEICTSSSYKLPHSREVITEGDDLGMTEFRFYEKMRNNLVSVNYSDEKFARISYRETLDEVNNLFSKYHKGFTHPDGTKQTVDITIRKYPKISEVKESIKNKFDKEVKRLANMPKRELKAKVQYFNDLKHRTLNVKPNLKPFSDSDIEEYKRTIPLAYKGRKTTPKRKSGLRQLENSVRKMW